MGRTKKLLMPQGWMSGSCGKQGGDERSVGRAKFVCSLAFPFLFFTVCLPPSLAHSGRRISYVVANRPRAGSRPSFLLLALLRHISLWDDGLLLRESNK